MKRDRYIGGEYYWKPKIFFTKKTFDLNTFLKSKYPKKQFSYTGGGIYSIYKIINDIGFKPNDEILLPSYICPTILIPFEKKKIKCKFFEINEKLEIELKDLRKKINSNTKAIFFINYFGFPPNKNTITELFQYKEKGIIIIEDCVQSFFSNNEIIGNYAFNSFRKFLPVDGSVIVSEMPIKKFSEKKITKYNFLKCIGQLLRYLTVEIQIVDFSRIFLLLFKYANDNYYSHENVSFNKFNRFILSRTDLNYSVLYRRDLFINLLNKYKDISLFKNIDNEVVPLGFPVLINNRNHTRSNLMKNKIYCPIHWTLPKQIRKSNFNKSIVMSSLIITIPLTKESQQIEL